jgi:hypothetical protein
VRPEDTVVLRHGLEPSDKFDCLLNLGDAVVDFYVDTDIRDCHFVGTFVIAEEVDQPASEFVALTRPLDASVVEDSVPEFRIYFLFSLVESHEFSKMIAHFIDIVLEDFVGVDGIFSECLQFGLKLLPILKLSSEMDLLDAALRNDSLIVKVFLVSLHDDASGKNLLNSTGAGKVALKHLSDSFFGIFLDLHNDFIEELIPLFF